MEQEEVFTEYDSDPVYYCAKCYSLKIKYEETLHLGYCMDCGCTDTGCTSIENWERMYEIRYGHKYVNQPADAKKQLFLKLPLSKLKTLVSGSVNWKDIIQKIYPKFPTGYTRVDSILLFFDHLIHDNRLDDLRILLFNLNKKGNGKSRSKDESSEE